MCAFVAVSAVAVEYTEEDVGWTRCKVCIDNVGILVWFVCLCVLIDDTVLDIDLNFNWASRRYQRAKKAGYKTTHHRDNIPFDSNRHIGP